MCFVGRGNAIEILFTYIYYVAICLLLLLFFFTWCVFLLSIYDAVSTIDKDILH